jgi:hypothetical protein
VGNVARWSFLRVRKIASSAAAVKS